MCAGGTATANSDPREGVRSGQLQHDVKEYVRGHESGDVVGIFYTVLPLYSSPFLHGAQPSYLIAIFGEGIVYMHIFLPKARHSSPLNCEENKCYNEDQPPCKS